MFLSLHIPSVYQDTDHIPSLLLLIYTEGGQVDIDSDTCIRSPIRKTRLLYWSKGYALSCVFSDIGQSNFEIHLTDV